ncbi:SRPBCC family protein [Mangrovibacterium diazotrophicum]|uniref:Activator of Hsp90 ATPase-like protein n=1 Tax=Mangrovibacterium diazotrophicum TaxID=1261403 RepID=A0A419W3Y9_9BACT|nr:SRPBCC family protein [Mangrovibacterium diazotrophicum]RKD90165.1 activator of Hsp90 ATPase-like protein [Mangrovibacterium diazotrophicum]
MKTFQTSREISASPGQVFDAISEPDRLARWWGPDGFSNTFKLFEFEAGGRWSFIMHGPDGTDYANESEFVEIIGNEKVVIRHLSQPHFTLTIQLIDSKTGTVVDWNQEFDSEEVANIVAPVVIPSNEQNLDRLTKEVCGS